MKRNPLKFSNKIKDFDLTMVASFSDQTLPSAEKSSLVERKKLNFAIKMAQASVNHSDDYQQTTLGKLLIESLDEYVEVNCYSFFF